MTFSHINRRTHLYLGLSLLPWLFMYAISSATFCGERTRYLCPPIVCGHRQNVHCAGQPRPV